MLCLQEVFRNVWRFVEDDAKGREERIERSLTKYSEVVSPSYLDKVRFVVVTNTSFRERWSTYLLILARVSKSRKDIEEEVLK